jgi:hypothetical protein
MAYLRVLAFSLLGASTLLGCGASGAKSSGTGDFGTGGAGTAGTGGGANGSGAGASSGAGTGGSGGGLVLDFDSGTGDAASGCTQLNIGILGNPGANPSSNFQQWLVMSGTSVQRIQTTTTEPLTAATLQPFDVVVLDWLTRDYTSAEAATFSAWVTAGGGVASLSGFSSTPADDWHANTLLAPLAVTYSGPPINGPVTSFATHPITAGLTSVTFNGGYAISDLGGTASARTPIAFLTESGGSVAVSYAIQMGSGRAFVWGDEWIEFDSEWSTIPQIKQLWVQVFAWVAPTGRCMLMPPQ